MRPVFLISVLLASCASDSDITELKECELEPSRLASGIAQALKLVEEEDQTTFGKYQFSADYGDFCGFWFEVQLRPEYPGDLLAGPVEVILSKDKLEYVDTKYYTHEPLVE